MKTTKEVMKEIRDYIIEHDKIPEKCQGCIHCYIGLCIGEDVLGDYKRCKDVMGIAYLNFDAHLGSGCSHEIYELDPFDDMSEEDVQDCPGYEEGLPTTWCPMWIQKRELERIKE